MVQYYSYHFQCWNCLHLHEGIIQSDSQELVFECNAFVPYEMDPLFNIMGKPRVCGRINHVYGRKTDKKNKEKS